MKIKFVTSLLVLSSALSAFASRESDMADAIAAFSKKQTTDVKECIIFTIQFALGLMDGY